MKHYVDAGIDVFKIAGREIAKPDFIQWWMLTIKEVLTEIYGNFYVVSLNLRIVTRN